MLFRIVYLLSWLISANAVAEQTNVVLYLPEAMPLAASGAYGAHGIFGDIAVEALKRANYPATLKSEPVLRAIKHLREEENCLLTPFTRTPEREDHYTWIAPVLPLARAFFTFTEPVQTIEQARTRYKSIGVGTGTAQGEILRNLGFRPEQIYSLQLGDTPIKMLERNRIDAWFATVPEGQYGWARNTNKRLLMSPPMATADMYLACSKRCDAKLVQALREAIEAMRADDTLTLIQQRYLGTAEGAADK